VTLYANIITSDGREETKQVFHQGVSRIVCRFSTTGAQNAHFVNLAADYKSKALLCMCKTCIRTVKERPECTKSRNFRFKIQKIFWGGGTVPSPVPTDSGEGDTPPHTLPPLRLRRLDSRAYGAQNSAPSAPRFAPP